MYTFCLLSTNYLSSQHIFYVITLCIIPLTDAALCFLSFCSNRFVYSWLRSGGAGLGAGESARNMSSNWKTHRKHDYFQNGFLLKFFVSFLLCLFLGCAYSWAVLFMGEYSINFHKDKTSFSFRFLCIWSIFDIGK